MPNALAPCCPICSGEGCLLGPMGPNTWFRCRQCGMDFYTPRQRTARTLP